MTAAAPAPPDVHRLLGLAVRLAAGEVTAKSWLEALRVELGCGGAVLGTRTSGRIGIPVTLEVAGEVPASGGDLATRFLRNLRERPSRETGPATAPGTTWTGSDDSPSPWLAGVVLARERGFSVDLLLCGRDTGLTRVELDALGSLAKRMRPLLFLGLELADLERRASAAEAALEVMPEALLIVDEAGRIVYENPAAARILAPADGLRRGDDRLHCDDQATAARLAELVQPQEAEGFLLVPRPSGRRPYQILASPIAPDLAISRAEGRRQVLLRILDPEELPAPPPGALRELFGLTTAEAGVVEQLLAGRSPTEIAARQDLSEATVRTHLSRIFQKTGSRGQTDLLRLLARSAAHPTERSDR